jgi:phosphoglycerate dehydrogenase-like enzyme
MTAPRLRVLVQLRPALVRRIADAVPWADVAAIPWDGDVPVDAHGEVLVTMAWGAPNLEQVLGRGVRWVHALGTGVDRFPFGLLGDRTLTCSRGGSSIPIAEWVLAVMLAFEKRLPDAWIDDVPGDDRSRMHLGTLHRRTLGLVGVGGIGAAVAERARPFGMRMIACRRTPGLAGPPGVEIVDSLSALVAAADHVVLAAPATPATRHLFDDRIFAVVKPGAHLVNVARGALVDQDALRRALGDGRVARASLDAVDPEPLPAGHWMYTHPKVRLSPHLSWNMPGAAEILVDAFIDNLHHWRAGEPLTGVVDRAAGY